MARCFCGCGRPVGFGHRALNKRGQLVRARIGEADRALGVVMGQSPTLERFIAEGLAIGMELEQAVHGEYDAGPEVEAWSRDWLRQGRPLTGNHRRALGKAVGKSGLTPEEFARGILEHDFGDVDPFAWTLDARRVAPDSERLAPFVDGLRQAHPDAERPHQGDS